MIADVIIFCILVVFLYVSYSPFGMALPDGTMLGVMALLTVAIFAYYGGRKLIAKRRALKRLRIYH